MIEIIPSENRQFTDLGWLKTYWLFSFSHYYDPNNISHGMLRVFNDDVVRPHTGFETHPHEEMEIVSIILDGEMVHEDTMGNKITIRKNEVQRMTAGTGLFHSEKNLSDAPVHFYQIWIKPDTKELEPSYDQKKFDPAAWENSLALLASDKPDRAAVKLNTKGSLFRCRLDKGRSVQHSPVPGWKTFIYLTRGGLNINDIKMGENDQARISDEAGLDIRALQPADFILIEVPSAP